MRYEEIIVHETTKNPLPYRWVEQSDAVHLAVFNINDIGYWVKIYRTRACMAPRSTSEIFFVFNFGVDSKTSIAIHGHTSGIMKPTGIGMGTQHKIISTVFSIADDFVKKCSPEIIYFSDSDNIRARAKLYQRFAQYLSDHHGYHFDIQAIEYFKQSLATRHCEEEPETATQLWVLRK
jgi:hypothetical protein